MCCWDLSVLRCTVLINNDFGARTIVRDFLNLLTVQVLVCVITYTHASKTSDVILIQSL